MGSVKNALKEVYSNIPNDFAYREVKFYLYHAIQKLENLEKKKAHREKEAAQQQIVREELEQKAKKLGVPVYQNTGFLREKIKLVDEMIAAEYKKIEEIKKNREQNGIQQLPEDDGDVQALHD